MTSFTQAFLARLRGDIPLSVDSCTTHAIYNEIDPFAADWLTQLEQAGQIAPGRVERRSIVDLKPDDVAGPGQRHFFAGIAGWSLAFRMAGVPDNANVWSGSCPCQPWSSAGKRKGKQEERHLWPYFFDLIKECRPQCLFGEQVASPLGYQWLDLVHADLEGADYAVGAAVLPAASVGAPHGRHRIFFGAILQGTLGDATGRVGFQMENLNHGGCEEKARQWKEQEQRNVGSPNNNGGAHASGERLGGFNPRLCRGKPRQDRVETSGGGPNGRIGSTSSPIGEPHFLGHPGSPRLALGECHGGVQREALDSHSEQAVICGSYAGWGNSEWVPCRDGTVRPVVPRSQLLAHGLPADVAVLCRRGTFQNRSAELKGFGNAIVPEVAATFIRAFLESVEELGL